MYQTWCQALNVAQVSQAGPSATTTQTSVLPSQAITTILPGMLEIGSILRITLIGQMSNVVTTPGTFDLKVFFGGATTVFDSGAQPMSTTAHTTLPHWWDCFLTCRAIGSSANFIGQSRMMGQMCLRSGGDVTTDGMQMAPNTAPAVGSNFSSTTSQTVDIQATFSVTTAGTAYTTQQYMLESLN